MFPLAPVPAPTPASARRSRPRRRLALGLAALLASASGVFAQIPAFPGAQGFGAYATGGRGGDVYYVTNLNSSGAGSLNHGIQSAPTSGRTIVFAVSGYISIANNSDTGNKTLRLVQNKITVAGQTAPGDGIGLKDGRVLLTGNNQVLRHLRIRHGKYGSAGDCLNLDSSATNSIIDHVSLMFSTDENISFFNSALDNFTMQYSTSAWGMERHNAGGLWDLVDGTCHHSLWAHHRTRNPKARPYGLLEWINNVTFHWRNEGFIMGDSQSNVSWKANVRGNYFLSIPDHQVGVDNTALSKARIAGNGQPNFALFLDNCLHDSNNNGLLDGTDKGYSIVSGQPFPNAGTTPGTVSYAKSATPFAGASGTATVVIDDPLTAYKKVLSNAGPLRLDATYSGALRDELDSLLISSVENQQSILVAKDSPLDANDTPSSGEALLAQPPYNVSNNGFGTLNTAAAPSDADLDGMPNYWESALGWNLTGQDHNTALASSGGILSGTTFMPVGTPAGYTRLEEYLHFKAIPHAAINRNTAGTPSSLAVDLRRYVRGFLKAPFGFTFANVSGGAVALQPDGYTAVFTPTLDYSGRARFDFTVTDGDGSSWTQTFGVLVKAAATPPAVPAGLAATAGNAQISLTWTTASGATGYKVKRATSAGGLYSTVGTPSVASFTNTGLTNGTTYHYVVSSTNEDGESANSASVSATPDAGQPYTLQAEAGTITGGTFDSNNAGFNATGFANLPTTGGSLQFNNLNGGSGGAATLVIRFALGNTARTGNLVVNGATQSITFPTTGTWTTWTTMSRSIPLNAGSTNTLRFETTGQDLANLDEITITPASPPVVTLAATDASAGETGDDRQLRFAATRTGSTTASLAVPLTASGTATPDADYAGFSGSLTIPAGQASGELLLHTVTDDEAEGAETVTLTLGAGAGFTIGTPDSATATIADAPAQAYFHEAIPDAGQRGPTDDPDGDGVPNLLEYFIGSDPVAGSTTTLAVLELPPSEPGEFKVRYPRAQNRPDVLGALQWSTDLATWRAGGESDGARTVNFAEAVISAPGADPETIEVTTTVTGPAAQSLFVRLRVE